MIKTSKIRKQEMHQAFENYNNHVSTCERCKYVPETEEDEITCCLSDNYYESWQLAKGLYEESEDIFKQELKDRGIQLP